MMEISNVKTEHQNFESQKWVGECIAGLCEAVTKTERSC